MKKPKPPKPDWEAAELAIKSTMDPVLAIAKRCHISEGTLRRRIKSLGWVRCPSEEKAMVVSNALAGVTDGMTDGEIRHAKAMEQASDIADMKAGITIYRNIICAMVLASENLVDTRKTPLPDPRDAKTIVEAAEKAITGLRAVRELCPKDQKESPEQLAQEIERWEKRVASLSAK